MKSLFSSIFFMCCAAVAYSQPQPEIPSSEFGLSFQPDHTFKGSSLKGWHTVGNSNWKAQNGEIIGTSTGSNGGWLVLDSSYQDVGFHALFKLNGNSESGILFRREKTDGGYRGVFLSLKKDDIAPYSITYDEQGREVKREKLRPAGGINYRMAPPPDTTANAGRRGNFASPPPPPADIALRVPNTNYRPEDWNMIEVFLETNVLRSFLNDGRELGGAIDGESAMSGFGPIALYVGGNGEVRFKDVAYKDISIRFTPKEKSSPRFRVERISDFYYSWGADAADFNRDGQLDIVSGPYIYFGPSFTNYKEIYPAIAVGPSKEFTSINHQFTYDVNQDGWPDVITGWTSPTVYINPGKESRRWFSYKPTPGTQSETTLFSDIDNDGKPELIYASQTQYRYAKPDAEVGKNWVEYNVSEKGYALAHGIGTGDINGDGRTDLLGANGWWEQPVTLNKDKTWKYHPYPFGRYKNRSSNVGGAYMAVYDANGDGLNDVVSGLNVHGFGMAWFEQKRDASGNITFVRHMISDDYSKKSVGNVTFSQAHGATSADVDGDGIMDFIVGKRHFTHLDNMFDPDSYGAPVTYWYKTVRNKNAPGGAEFVPELIHNRSGAGSEITPVDLNKDGAIDFITATNRGTFIYWNKPSARKSK